MKRTNYAHRPGAAVVELAITLPIFLLFTFGTLEICTGIGLRKSLTIAAYEGAMTAVLPGATAADVIEATQTILNDRGIAQATIHINPINLEAAVPGAQLQIEVRAPYSPNGIVLGGLFSSTTLSGRAVVIKEY